ncbi:MAG TPA: 3-hydroxyacyl-CoA dehydrogenase family protein [Candidatus Dormibacteraeota bacterium]|nr:3-hydroxyacyl-CoA dehydrogenase family protein [Candidatus Dormibacteraeota bacterium]
MEVDAVRRIGVVGAGTMGSQIALVAALGGYDVALCGRTPERLEATLGAATRVLRRRVEKGTLAGDACEAALARVTRTTELASAVEGADVVVETVAENAGVKERTFRELDAHAPAGAILASNSSTMASSRFAACVSDPSRLLNVHFFNPALTMRLVEVVRGPHTSEATVACAMELVRRMGRTPVLVRRETFGFLVNRMLFIGMQEAFRLAEDGVVSREDADLAVRNGLNWPMGPFELADLIGLDVTADILEQGAAQTGDPRWLPTPGLRALVDAGRHGRKTGGGFFDHPR